MLKSYDFRCQECGFSFWTTMESGSASWEASWECPECQKPTVKRVPSAPNLMQRALPDGVKRGGGYQELKEAAKLEKESMDLPWQQRAEIRKEIKKLQEVKK
jgi:putative FmdB family regulatory protein